MVALGDITAVGGLAVATWAAWTAHRARQWQRAEDQRRRTPNVRVGFSHATLERPAWADPRPIHRRNPVGPRPLGYALDVTVINDGPTTVWIRGLYVEEAHEIDGRGTSGIDLHYPFRNGDIEIKPNQRYSDRIWADSETRLDFSNGVLAKALLASGELVYSNAEFLMDDMLASIRTRDQ